MLFKNKTKHFVMKKIKNFVLNPDNQALVFLLICILIAVAAMFIYPALDRAVEKLNKITYIYNHS